MARAMSTIATQRPAPCPALHGPSAGRPAFFSPLPGAGNDHYCAVKKPWVDRWSGYYKKKNSPEGRAKWDATTRARFQSKISRKPNQGPRGDCLLWTGNKNNLGYGIFWINNRYPLAHRVAWAFAYGGIPARLNVLHKCDTPLCVNPAHLFLGTNTDNMQDCSRKGRIRVDTYKYSDEQIRDALAASRSAKELMAHLGCTLSYAHRVFSGQRRKAARA